MHMISYNNMHRNYSFCITPRGAHFTNQDTDGSVHISKVSLFQGLNNPQHSVFSQRRVTWFELEALGVEASLSFPFAFPTGRGWRFDGVVPGPQGSLRLAALHLRLVAPWLWVCAHARDTIDPKKPTVYM